MPPRSRTSTGKAAKAGSAAKGSRSRKPKAPDIHDIVVVGAGLAGLAQARMLQQRGFATHLIDPRERDSLRARSADRRATALTPASVQLLDLPADWLAVVTEFATGAKVGGEKDGVQVDWVGFWRQAYRGNEVVDFGVHRVANLPHLIDDASESSRVRTHNSKWDVHVELRRFGSLAVPVEYELLWSDGMRTRHVWRGDTEAHALRELGSDRRVVQVVVINKLNAALPVVGGVLFLVGSVFFWPSLQVGSSTDTARS